MRTCYARLALAAVFSAICLSGSALAQSSQDLYGTLTEGRYSNNLLKFELSIPDGWLVVESEDQKAAKEIGRAAVQTGNARADALIDESLKKDVIVLFVSEKPLGAIGNAVFGISITKLPAKGYTPKMLAESFKSAFLQNPKNRVAKEISLENIGGLTWANVLLDLDFFGQPVHNNYFVTVVGDYALVSNMSYQNSDQLRKMDAALRGIKFKRK